MKATFINVTGTFVPAVIADGALRLGSTMLPASETAKLVDWLTEALEDSVPSEMTLRDWKTGELEPAPETLAGPILPPVAGSECINPPLPDDIARDAGEAWINGYHTGRQSALEQNADATACCGECDVAKLDMIELRRWAVEQAKGDRYYASDIVAYVMEGTLPE
jgi:hypothetical protein